MFRRRTLNLNQIPGLSEREARSARQSALKGLRAGDHLLLPYVRALNVRLGLRHDADLEGLGGRSVAERADDARDALYGTRKRERIRERAAEVRNAMKAAPRY